MAGPMAGPNRTRRRSVRSAPVVRGVGLDRTAGTDDGEPRQVVVPSLGVLLDGVGNPHNLGAILRSAAHFGVGALLLPKDSGLALSGAAARVAEGGAEDVPIVRRGRSDNALDQLRSAGFVIAATVVRGGASLHQAKLPARLVFVLGAEQHGVDPALAMASLMQLEIPGRGAVESLNVASAASVLMSEWLRQHPAR